MTDTLARRKAVLSAERFDAQRLRCPFCRSRRNFVVGSRDLTARVARRRRYECIDCTRRFTTYETLEGAPVVTPDPPHKCCPCALTLRMTMREVIKTFPHADQRAGEGERDE